MIIICHRPLYLQFSHRRLAKLRPGFQCRKAGNQLAAINQVYYPLTYRTTISTDQFNSNSALTGARSAAICQHRLTVLLTCETLTYPRATK